MSWMKRLTVLSWTTLIVLALTGVYGAQQQISSGTLHMICDSGCSAGAPGQAAMAASSPVVIASDQSAVAGKAAINTYVDGAIVTLGANADAAVGDATGTLNAHIRQIAKSLAAGIGVTGTFWQATQPVSIATAPALVASVANIGIVRAVPSSCTQSTPFASQTVGVATGAGTSITSTPTCVTLAYANNITNSAATLRIQDKTGTPIIWVGGNADFSIAANSSVRLPLDGVTFVGGMTAIAGTGSAINLDINGLQ